MIPCKKIFNSSNFYKLPLYLFYLPRNYPCWVHHDNIILSFFLSSNSTGNFKRSNLFQNFQITSKGSCIPSLWYSTDKSSKCQVIGNSDLCLGHLGKANSLLLAKIDVNQPCSGHLLLAIGIPRISKILITQTLGFGKSLHFETKLASFPPSSTVLLPLNFV